MHRLSLMAFLCASVLLEMPPVRAGEPDRTIRVTGEGRAAAPPDMATIQTGVISEADTAAEALDDNNQAMERMLDVLRDHGIRSRDVQTLQFEVSPVHDHDDRRRRLPEIIGYRVTNQVQVRVRQLEKLGEVLDALVRAGSNRVNAISLGIDDPAEVQNQARRKAIEDARQRAGVYAGAAGVGVGPVRRISEEPVGIPRPMMMQRAMAEAAAVPVEPGELELHITVTVVFALRSRESDEGGRKRPNRAADDRETRALDF